MDKKSLNVVVTELTLLQIQLNAALLLLQAQHPTMPIRERFQHLVDEDVEVAGLESMQRFKERLRGGSSRNLATPLDCCLTQHASCPHGQTFQTPARDCNHGARLDP